MAALPPITFRIAPRIYDYAKRLFARRSSRSALLDLGPYRANLGARAYPAYPVSAGLTRSYARHRWQRQKLPLYGSTVINMPGRAMTVPGGALFAYQQPTHWPNEIPNISFRSTRSPQRYLQTGIPVPTAEMVASYAPPGGSGRYPPEYNRRRKDQKIPYGIARLYRLLSTYYGPVTEWLELNHIYQLNKHDPAALMTALAVNQAVERAYGERASILKQVYKQSFYTLPVGYDTISRLWR